MLDGPVVEDDAKYEENLAPMRGGECELTGFEEEHTGSGIKFPNPTSPVGNIVSR